MGDARGGRRRWHEDRLKPVLHVGVEDADLRPRRGIFRDELAVAFGDLIGIVGRVRLEDEQQGDVEVTVVDLTVIAGTGAD